MWYVNIHVDRHIDHKKQSVIMLLFAFDFLGRFDVGPILKQESGSCATQEHLKGIGSSDAVKTGCQHGYTIPISPACFQSVYDEKNIL